MSTEKKHIVYPYIPNSNPKVKEAMMEKVDAKDEMDLYDMIPEDLRLDRPLDIPEPFLDEFSLRRHGEEILDKNEHSGNNLTFLGGGIAEHFVPSIVDEVIGRSEILTAYSGSGNADNAKGQLVFEYCSMMAELVDMDCLSLSQVCGGESTASTLRMASRLTGRNKVILPKNMTPDYIKQIKNYCGGIKGSHNEGLEFVFVDYDERTGQIDLEDLEEKMSDEIAGVYIQNPNYLGVVETQVREIKAITEKYDSEFIVHVDPITLGVMEAPGTYGATIVCGNIQSLGIHMGAGSGVAGFIAVPDDERYIFNLKDVLFGYSPTPVEGEFNISFTTAWDRTMYGSREQGIEFTGTTAALWTVAAGVYLATMGPKGMYEVGQTIMQRSQYAKKRLEEIKGIKPVFNSPFFKEFIINYDTFGKTVEEVNKELRKFKIFGGIDLSKKFPDLGQSALICVTETHRKEDIDRLADALETVLLS